MNEATVLARKRDQVVGAARAQRRRTATRVDVRAPQHERWPPRRAHRPVRGRPRGVAVCVQRSRVIRRQHRRDTAGGGHDAPLPWAWLRPFRPGHSHVESADSPLFCAHVKAARFEGFVPRPHAYCDRRRVADLVSGREDRPPGSPRLWPVKTVAAQLTDDQRSAAGSQLEVAPCLRPRGGECEHPRPHRGRYRRGRESELEGLPVCGLRFTRPGAQSARPAGDPVMTMRPWAGNASGRTSFNPARSSAAVHAHRSVSFWTRVTIGCSLDCPAEPPPFDPGNEKDQLNSCR